MNDWLIDSLQSWSSKKIGGGQRLGAGAGAGSDGSGAVKVRR